MQKKLESIGLEGLHEERYGLRGDRKMVPRVSIIILNWNGWKDTLECLESFYQITYPNYDVILVDNGSEDESIEKIKEYCEGKIKVESKFFEYSSENKPIKIIEYTREEAEGGGGKEGKIKKLPSNRKLILIKNEKNYGFAEGNNVGMRYALRALSPGYVLLLNNDTVVDREFLSELVRVAEGDEKIGVVGPKMYYYDFKGQSDVLCSAGGTINPWREQIAAHIGLGEKDQGQYDEIREVDWIVGCALMLKATTIKRLSLLDPKYFFGHEDVAYCIRAREHGLKVVFVPASRLWHKIGASRAKIGDHVMDFPMYFALIKESFPWHVYVYHILLFFMITLPKWAIIYTVRYRDKRTFCVFMSKFKKLVMRR